MPKPKLKKEQKISAQTGYFIPKKRDQWLKFKKQKQKEEQRKIEKSIKLSKKIIFKESDESDDVDITSFDTDQVIQINIEPTQHADSNSNSDLLAELFSTDEQ